MKTEEPGKLAGKVAVVTGASRGIGLAIADAMVNQGCFVFAVSRHVAKTRSSTADSREPFACDVRDDRAVARLFAAVEKRFRRLDFLVNNAGIAHALLNTEATPLPVWREVLDTNLTGTFLCTRAALPLMSRGGVIVNNVSVAGRGVFAGEAAYCASKHGVLGFTDTVREEVRERGIRVLALLPGPTATDIWNQFMPEAPRKKMMSPETVAQAVINALLLPANSAVEEILIRPVSGAI